MIPLLLLLAQTGGSGPPVVPPDSPHPGDRDAPASQPAAAQPGGTGADITGNVTWIFETDERILQIQETWSLLNESGRLVGKEHLVFPMAEGTKQLVLNEETSKGFQAAEDGSRVLSTEDMGPGTKTFTDSHRIDFSSDTVVVRRTVPVRTVNARLIVENISGLDVTSNVEMDKRVRDLNGLEFQVITFAPINVGQTIEFKLEGLPSRTAWPRRMAMAVALAIVGWAFWALRRPPSEAAAKLGPLSAQARRDRIVKAIEILERDLAEDKIKDKRYERRHEELMTELATVLREIDLVKSSE